MTRGWSVATAVVWRAQMRTALDHFARNFDLRLAWVVAVPLCSAAPVFRDAACLGRVASMFGGVPIGRPLPDIPDHVGKAETVRRKSFDGRGARVTIGREILAGEFALPGVGHVTAGWHQRIAPRKLGLIKATA